MINESVQFVIEQLNAAGGRLRINHISDFPVTVMRNGFQAAERFGLKNYITEIEKAKGGPFKRGSVHLQWHGSHIDANGTAMAAKYQILYSYIGEIRNGAWLALCFAKMAQEGHSLVKAGYLNVRSFDDKVVREECWTWIAGHFGSNSLIPTSKTDPKLFAKILGEEGESESTKTETKPNPYNKEQNEAIARLKSAGVDFRHTGETLALKPTPQILSDLKIVSAAGILDYMEDGGLYHYEVNSGIDLDENVAITSPMNISKNPFITEANEYGATFSKSGVVVEWVHGAVRVGKTFLGNAGTMESASKIAHEVLDAKSINEAVTARAAKAAAHYAING